MVDTDYTDDWGTESGLIDNFVIRVDESWFATDARYNNGETLLLNWKGKVDQPIGSDGESEFTVSFPVGGGWVSNDGGVSAVSEKGKAKFNKQSIYGRIVESAMKGKGDEDGLGIFDIVKGRGRPTQAAIWTGLTFRMRQVEFNYGGEIGKKSRVMPVEFLGENADPDGFAEAGAGAGAGAGVSASSNGAGDLETRLRVVAKAAADHAAFVDKALEIPEVSEDAALLERVVDETKIYSEARA